jgi:N4-gp56 family major capsid protein
MAQTTSSAIAGLVTFDIQERVIDNLRANLLYANRAFSAQGTLMKGSDTARFVFIPDLSNSTTPMTEGTTPSSVQLSETHVDVSAAQYGNVVDISDVAKLKSPVDLISEASEHLSRNAQVVIDTVTRDAIATGGTPFYAEAKTSRAGLASTSKVTAADLRKLRAKMFKNLIPPNADGYYTLILGAEQGFDLRSDTSTTGGWADLNKYSQPENVMKSEMGRMEGFRIVEAQSPPTFSSTVPVTAAIAFGAIKGWGVADLQTLEVHHVAPGGDHYDLLGLSELLGWKVMFGVATLANNRYYRLESATTAL